MLAQALPTISLVALAIGVGSALIFLMRRLSPGWPGVLIAVILASLAAWLFGLPGPLMPSISYASLLEVLPAAPLHCSAASASPEGSPVPPPIFVPEPTARSPA